MHMLVIVLFKQCEEVLAGNFHFCIFSDQTTKRIWSVLHDMEICISIMIFKDAPNCP